MLSLKGKTTVGKLLYDLNEKEIKVVPESIKDDSGNQIEINIQDLVNCLNEYQIINYIRKELNKVVLPELLAEVGLLPEQIENLVNTDSYLGAGFYSLIRYYYHQNNLSPHLEIILEDKYCPLDSNLSIDYIINTIGHESNRPDGRFTKRFSKCVFDKWGVKLPKEIITQIGNCYNQFRLNNKPYNIKVTNDLSWKDGQYGKKDSCWWGCYTNSRDTLYHYGGYGLLFYPTNDKTHDDSDGIGRAWVYPIDDDQLIIFNVYGVEGRVAAAVLSKLLEDNTDKKWKYGNRKLKNTDDDDYPYINGDNGHNSSGGAKGFVVYSGDVAPPSTIEFTMHRKSGYFFTTVECSNCENRIDEDNTCIARNGRIYCNDCYDELFTSCEHCGEEIRRNDTYFFDDAVGDYCESCRDAIEAYGCSNCGKHFMNNSGMITDVNDETWCPVCARRNLEHCELHDTYYPDRDFCPDCDKAEEEAQSEVGRASKYHSPYNDSSDNPLPIIDVTLTIRVSNEN